MVPCSPEVIDIGPGIVNVALQALTVFALALGLERNYQAIKTAGSNGSMKNGASISPVNGGPKSV